MPCIVEDDGSTYRAQRKQINELTNILCELNTWRVRMGMDITWFPKLFQLWVKDHEKADQSRIDMLKKEKDKKIAQLKKQRNDIHRELLELEGYDERIGG